MVGIILCYLMEMLRLENRDMSPSMLAWTDGRRHPVLPDEDGPRLRSYYPFL